MNNNEPENINESYHKNPINSINFKTGITILSDNLKMKCNTILRQYANTDTNKKMERIIIECGNIKDLILTDMSDTSNYKRDCIKLKLIIDKFYDKVNILTCTNIESHSKIFKLVLFEINKLKIFVDKCYFCKLEKKSKICILK